MKYPIVMLTGHAGAGKDCIAEMIAKKTNGTVISLADPLKQLVQAVYPFESNVLWGPSKERETVGTFRSSSIRLAFNNLSSHPVFHSIFNEIYRFRPTEPLEHVHVSARHLLQTIGTGIREILPDYWWQKFMENANTCLTTGYHYNRQTGALEAKDNQANLVVCPDSRFRNEILAVKRAGGFVIKVVDPNKKNTDQHPSEKQQESIPDYWFDLILRNYKEDGLEGLDEAVTRMVNQYILPVDSIRSEFWSNGKM